MTEAPKTILDVNSQLHPETILGMSGFDRKGSIYRQQLSQAITHYGSALQLPTDARLGYTHYLINTFPDNHFNPRTLFEFLQSMIDITSGVNFHKSRSFNYLPTSDDVGEVLDQAAKNARFMVDVFGMGFFTRRSEFSTERATLFRSIIPDSNFYLSAKGGSGAGTFSVDFALGIEKGRGFDNTSGELWRGGFDTEKLADGGVGARIIRTGNGVKFDSVKASKFDEFKSTFKISPARALTFVLLQCIGFLDPAKVSALTTEGAKTISSLPSKSTAYNYTALFREFGFESQASALWMELVDKKSPRKREIPGMGRIFEAVESLVDSSGQPFPLK